MYHIFFVAFNVEGEMFTLRNQWYETVYGEENVKNILAKSLKNDEEARNEAYSLFPMKVGEVSNHVVGNWDIKNTVLQVQIVKMN